MRTQSQKKLSGRELREQLAFEKRRSIVLKQCVDLLVEENRELREKQHSQVREAA
jgi:hypothetical protein